MLIPALISVSVCCCETVCGACHPKNDFWGCPFPLYVIVQVLSAPIRLGAGLGCGALGFAFDILHWLYWFGTGCGFCNAHANQTNGCGPATPAQCKCRYYIGANVKSKNNGSGEAGTGSREIRGCSDCIRAVCCVIPQDRTQESVCFECCEGSLPTSNITPCFNPQNTASEQHAVALDIATRSNIHGDDVPRMTRGDDFV